MRWTLVNCSFAASHLSLVNLHRPCILALGSVTLQCLPLDSVWLTLATKMLINTRQAEAWKVFVHLLFPSCPSAFHTKTHPGQPVRRCDSWNRAQKSSCPRQSHPRPTTTSLPWNQGESQPQLPVPLSQPIADTIFMTWASWKLKKLPVNQQTRKLKKCLFFKTFLECLVTQNFYGHRELILHTRMFLPQQRYPSPESAAPTSCPQADS